MNLKEQTCTPKNAFSIHPFYYPLKLIKMYLLYCNYYNKLLQARNDYLEVIKINLKH